MSAGTTRVLIGLDVGSTTIKAVAVDADRDEIRWRDYQRHETRQPEKAVEFLDRIGRDLAVPPERMRVFVTGSGGAVLAEHLGARFVQEVTAVALAVEKLHPEAGSVVELGGQDAKIILFRRDATTGRANKILSMNDKCAGGTGAVVDKIAAKLRLTPDQLGGLRYRGVRLHPVAGKCGVFAETDINSLQKLGVPAEELMASLYDALVGQNLSVLTRGNTLRPHVLLLGGPNSYLPGLVEAWQDNIAAVWAEREVALPPGRDPRDMVGVPDNALYFAAMGAVEFGRTEAAPTYRGTGPLRHHVATGRRTGRVGSGERALAGSAEELAEFLARYRRPSFEPARFAPGEVVEAFVGLDGGSTSTKAVLLDRSHRVLAKAYQLSKGNPIEDTKDVLARLEDTVVDQGATLRVLGVGTTGYAKDILADAIGADAALVETVAHTAAARDLYDDLDVICDVGGQDIKIIALKDGRVTDFRLNTQCSAGNGYFLQATAAQFGYSVQEYADVAFTAQRMPTFGHGCAVFLQSDIVDFQRQGWQREEILAGLAAVLPKNIWLYVAQMPNLPLLGRSFVLSGGTQHNLAAVKAQVDFITARFAGQAQPPRVLVHEHCGEAGAIGCAIEAQRLADRGRVSPFVGMDAVRRLSYTTFRGEDTRCGFCRNQCLRTFIDVSTGPASFGTPSTAPRRLVVGNSCDRGLVDDVAAMRAVKTTLQATKAANPNFAELAGRAVWRARRPEPVADPPVRVAVTASQRARNARLRGRESLRIGIPRALNLYSTNPFFSAYFESLGVPFRNLVYSDVTSEQLFREGVRRGAIDPCYPSKLGLAHVHNLLTVQHRRRPLDLVFFPMIDALPPGLTNTQVSRACPTVTVTPESVKAAFTKEGDLFAQLGIRYLDPLLDLSDELVCARQLYLAFADVLGLTPAENERAVAGGFRELDAFFAQLRGSARETLDRLEAEDRIGVVLLGRPYHNDPGIAHGIPEELQKAGYPVFTQDTLPTDDDLLWRLFGDEVRAGVIAATRDISDVWKNTYSENTSRKLWAAKYVARHPNLVAVELSNFKCGHDAPVYSTIERIVQDSGTPYFCFKDIDENKPTSSIRLRVETIRYFLERYREETLIPRQRKLAALQEHLASYEARLRAEAG